jgi:uncharacterized protein YjiS (DUF1127 family)
MFHELKILFAQADQKLYFTTMGFVQAIGIFASWLGANWMVVSGVIFTGLIPAIMALRKHREEMRQLRRMNDVAYQKALKEAGLTSEDVQPEEEN